MTALLSVTDLSVEYRTENPVRAVRDVSLDIAPGEIVGLAGESGCGKTTFAYAISQLLTDPAVITGGSASWTPEGRKPVDILALKGRALRSFRWAEISMVFQGAMNSLNPVKRIGSQLEDVLVDHSTGLDRAGRRARARELLELVRIDPDRVRSYPHELSGGMRQRVMIAMALALDPRLVIMDEPTTALDVVVQREILQEIDRLRHELGFAVLFITHDLALLLEISDRVGIMLDGRLVDVGTPEKLMRDPGHAYTEHLLASFPSVRGEHVRSAKRYVREQETDHG